VVVNVFLTFTCKTTPDSYDATALAIIKPRKHQRLADLLLHSCVGTRKNRVCYNEHCFA